MKLSSAGAVTTGPHLAPRRPTLSPTWVAKTPKATTDQPAVREVKTAEPSVKKRIERICSQSPIHSRLSQASE